MVNYSHITLEAGMVMKKASGVDSPLRQSAGKSSDLPETMAAVYGLLSGYPSLYLGFSRRGDYIGEGGESEAVQGGHTLARRGQGVARAWGGMAALWPPSSSSSGF